MAGRRVPILLVVAVAATLVPGLLALRTSTAANAAVTGLPAGFVDTTVFSGLTNPTVVQFGPDGRVWVGEKSGLIKVFASINATTPTVAADLRTAVHNWWDRGLLGLVLDPQFPTKPYIYVQYTYDAQPGVGTVPRWGTPGATEDYCPSPPGGTESGCVVQGRISRLTVSNNGAGNTIVAGSETVLVQDWCEQFPSHSIGTIAFGPDGYLYAAGGDGASFTLVDYGQQGGSGGVPVNPCGDTGGGTTTGEGGALRAQSVRTAATATGPSTLDGAVIRIDPTTGAAAPGNPYAARANPNERRIIASGLRNPFRLTFRPGTSELWMGDVGWNDTEEIDRFTVGGATAPNFGWPCYEGNVVNSGYQAANLSLCNSLYSQGPSAVAPPYFSYSHNASVVSGDGCTSGATPYASSITGLAFYSGTSYPATYRDALFFTDYNRKCLWVMKKGSNGLPDPTQVSRFAKLGQIDAIDTQTGGGAVDLVAGPGGDLFWVDLFGGEIHRISYPAANQPPTVAVTATPSSGAAPLAVTLDASASTDPEGNVPLSFSWDLDNNGTFGDATGAIVNTTFSTAGTSTPKVRVTDSLGASAVGSVSVAVGNTPPVPTINTPAADTSWKVGDAIAFSGSGTDGQDGTLGSAALSWRIRLLTCSTPTDCITRFEQTAVGTGGTYAVPDWGGAGQNVLEFALTARDSGGLTTTVTRRIDPRTATLRLESAPPGLSLALGSEVVTTPFTGTVIEGSASSVGAPSPQTLGINSYQFDSWSDGGSASHTVTTPAGGRTLTANYTQMAVTTVPGPAAGGWTLNGSATIANGLLELTPTTPANQRGTAIWPTPLPTQNLTIDTQLTIGGGTGGADGMTLAFLAPTTPTTALGTGGGGLALSGLTGTAIALDTYQNYNATWTTPIDPSNNFIGLTNGNPAATDSLTWVTTNTNIANLRQGTHQLRVTTNNNRLVVTLDNTTVIDVPNTLPPTIRLAFTAATGGSTDRHAVGPTTITVGGATPTASNVTVSPTALDLGSVTVGSSSTATFTMTNTGGVPATLTAASVPTGVFADTAALPVGTTIAPGASLTRTVRFTPTAPGTATASYSVTFDDGLGPRAVALTGLGVAAGGGGQTVPPPSAGGWQLNGSALMSGASLELTPVTPGSQRGSAVWPTPVATNGLRAEFDIFQGGGTGGGDGMTFALLNPAAGATALGVGGGGLAFSGLNGVAVAFDTYQNYNATWTAPIDPSNNFVGVSTGGTVDSLPWLATSTSVPSLRSTVRHVIVDVAGGRLKVNVAGTQILDVAVAVPANALLAFTGATGGSTDRHAVTNVVITPPNSTPAPQIAVTPPTVDVASVAVGSSTTRDVTIANSGNAPATVTTVSALAAPWSLSALTPGTVVPAGASLTRTVTFAPTAAGPSTATLSIGFDSGVGTRSVALTGTGTVAGGTTTVPGPAAGGWTLNGSATIANGLLELTPTTPANQRGTAIWPTPLPTQNLTIDTQLTIGGGTGGADGMTLAFLAPTTPTTALGTGGGGLALSGLTGTAIALDTYQNYNATWTTPIDPSNNFIGLTNGNPAATDSLTWVTTNTNIANLRQGTHQLRVTTNNNRLVVTLDNTTVIDVPNTLPPTIRLAFTAATGGSTDRHAVGPTTITVG